MSRGINTANHPGRKVSPDVIGSVMKNDRFAGLRTSTSTYTQAPYQAPAGPPNPNSRTMAQVVQAIVTSPKPTV